MRCIYISREKEREGGRDIYKERKGEVDKQTETVMSCCISKYLDREVYIYIYTDIYMYMCVCVCVCVCKYVSGLLT